MLDITLQIRDQMKRNAEVRGPVKAVPDLVPRAPIAGDWILPRIEKLTNVRPDLGDPAPVPIAHQLLHLVLQVRLPVGLELKLRGVNGQGRQFGAMIDPLSRNI